MYWSKRYNCFMNLRGLNIKMISRQEIWSKFAYDCICIFIGGTPHCVNIEMGIRFSGGCIVWSVTFSPGGLTTIIDGNRFCLSYCLSNSRGQPSASPTTLTSIFVALQQQVWFFAISNVQVTLACIAGHIHGRWWNSRRPHSRFRGWSFRFQRKLRAKLAGEFLYLLREEFY